MMGKLKKPGELERESQIVMCATNFYLVVTDKIKKMKKKNRVGNLTEEISTNLNSQMDPGMNDMGYKSKVVQRHYTIDKGQKCDKVMYLANFSPNGSEVWTNNLTEAMFDPDPGKLGYFPGVWNGQERGKSFRYKQSIKEVTFAVS